MSPDLTPEQVRRRAFDTALRGYDKAIVDAFRDEVAAELSRLHERIQTLEQHVQQLGIDEPGDLAVELRKVGEDVSAILDEARRTATELRERAAADAAQWRGEAEAESTAVCTAAQAEAEQIRSDAWNQSSQMLEQVTQDVDEQIAMAKQDALFIRAEAERESLHMTADARREAEDVLRAAKTEAERMSTNAQAEAARTLDEARRAAEGAQERARALEERRAELLIELDAARSSIGQLEKQIDERREVLEEASPTVPTPAGADWEQQPRHWGDDEGSVRLVAPLHLREPTPVDADELVEEVERLREGVLAAELIGPEDGIGVELDVAAPQDESDDDGAAVAADADDDGEPAEDASTVVEDEPTHMEIGADAGADDPEPPAAGDGVGETAEDDGAMAAEGAAVVVTTGPGQEDASDTSGEPAAPEEDEAEATAVSGEADDHVLDDLFQRLRSDDGVAPTPTPADEPEEDAPVESPAAPVEPETVSVEHVVEEAPQQLGEPAADAPAEAPSLSVGEAVDLRDRLLLPIENRALRSVKRRIVDLQNRALEELRIGDGSWTPDRAMFTADLGPDLGKLAQEAFVAGHRAAAEMSGTEGVSPPSTRTRTDAVAMVVDPLATALASSYDRTVAQEGGARQVAAAVSRVFRAWRTDEAERRLRMVGYTAYHEGIVTGFAAMGVAAAVVVAEGAHAELCPAVTGAPFDPAASSALRLPPAHEDCASTIVLAG